MKNSLQFAIIFFLLSHSIFAQQKRFSAGFVIDNTGTRVEGFIRTSDLELINSENATIDFMTSLEGQSTKMLSSDLIEVGIENDIRYKKITVQLDDSDINATISYNRKFNFVPKTLFLNVLVAGDATLYSYESSRGTKYFYKLVNDDAVEQLQYKKYYVASSESTGKTLREITEFRQQLSKDVSCLNDSFNKFSNLAYDKTALMAIFAAYNACQNSETVVFKNEKKSVSGVKFSAYAGIANMSVKITDTNPEPEQQNDLNYSFGAELEFIKSKNNFGFFARIEVENGQSTTSAKRKITELSDDIVQMNYRFDVLSFNSLAGVRYHRNNFFVDAAVGVNFGGYDLSVTKFRITNGTNLPAIYRKYYGPVAPYFSFGLGYNVTRKFGVQLRMDTAKTIEEDGISLKYSQIGINARYTFN